MSDKNESLTKVKGVRIKQTSAEGAKKNVCFFLCRKGMSEFILIW